MNNTDPTGWGTLLQLAGDLIEEYNLQPIAVRVQSAGFPERGLRAEVQVSWHALRGIWERLPKGARTVVTRKNAMRHVSVELDAGLWLFAVGEQAGSKATEGPRAAVTL